MNEKLKELIRNETSKKDVEKIGIKNIEPSGFNSFDAKNYDDLKNSIRAMGLITPLSVIGPSEEGMYQIISGERRYRALSELNEETDGAFSKIPCYIIGPFDMDEAEQKLLIETSNLEIRDDYNKNQHRFRILKILKEMSDETHSDDDTPEKKLRIELIRDFSSTLKVSNRYGKMYVQIFENGSDDLKDLLSDDDTSIKISEGAVIANLPDDDEKKAIERIKNGEKASDVIKDIKSSSAVGKVTSAPEFSDDYEDYDDYGDDSYNDDSYNDDGYEETDHEPLSVSGDSEPSAEEAASLFASMTGSTEKKASYFPILNEEALLEYLKFLSEKDPEDLSESEKKIIAFERQV